MSGARESHFSGSERRLLELIRSAAAENKSHGEVMRNTASVAPIKRRTSRESVARNPSATRTGRTPNRNAGTRRAVVTAAMSTRLASLGRCEHERDSFWCVPRAHQPALQRTSAARADGNHGGFHAVVFKGGRETQRPIMRDAEEVSWQSHVRVRAVREQCRSPRRQDAGPGTKRRRWPGPPPSSASQRSRDPARRSTRP